MNRGTSRQIVYADQADHMTYDRMVRSLVHGLVDINRHDRGLSVQ